MDAVYEQNAKIFKAFCDENRLRVLTLLQEGEMCACVLMDRLGIKQSALSYHMKVLVDAGVVESRPVGKWTHYHLCAQGCAFAREQLQHLTEIRAVADTFCACARVDGTSGMDAPTPEPQHERQSEV